MALKPQKAELAKLTRQIKENPQAFEVAPINHPLFRGGYFPVEVAETLAPMFADRGARWLKQLSQVSQVSRTLIATLDLSAPFIQGLLVFGKNPLIWAKGVVKMLHIAADPQFMYRELQARGASRLERATYGASMAGFEFFEGHPVIQRIAKKIPGGERFVRATYGRAEAAWVGFSEIARDELWKANKLAISRRPLTEAAKDIQLREAARVIDRMTGVMSTEALGIGLTQRQVENTWVFFAPRYTRAGMSIMADILRGGLTGAEARKALGGYLLGALTLYKATTEMLGQQMELDPRSGRFMTVELGGRHVGVGGFTYAAMRLMANISATATEEPSKLLPTNLSRVDNPFYNFMYARTSPLTSMTMGLAIEHKDFMGRPFETIIDYAKFMADKVLPIAAQSVLDRRPWESPVPPPVTIATEFAGLRVFPKASWEARDEARENVSRSEKGKSWNDLSRAEQRELELNFPIIGKYDAEIKKSNLQRGRPEQLLYNEWQDRIDAAKAYRDERLNRVAERAKGDRNYYQFRLSVTDIENDYAAQMQQTSSDKRYQELMATLNEPKTREQLSKMNYLDAAYTVYAQVRYSGGDTPWGAMQNEVGEPEWDSIEKFRRAFAEKFGQEALNYAEQERPLAGRSLPPIYLELRRARQILRPYWQIKDEVIREIGEPRTPEDEREVNREIQKRRQGLRERNPTLNRYYLMFYSRGTVAYSQGRVLNLARLLA